ncbi:MAG: DUF4233 domain-containing protein [Austwickia sp.]|nr:DUF4233 domain-containing protein [Actinomycetota bacterium]MCB1253342.1 DUF4233 domain-containing protein [Austwickia sp.]MCO5310853.1 DUF4233 domain-containing protein [Austwickia sp.]
MNLPPLGGPQRKMTRRLAAVVLGSQAPVVLFGAVGARALADASGHGAATTYLWVGVGLAVACALVAGLLRTPVGVSLGWLVQVATLLCGFVVPVMVVIGVIFGGLWWVALAQGVRLDDMTEAYLREHPNEA